MDCVYGDGKNRVCGGLTERAERVGFKRRGDLFKFVEIFQRSVALGDSCKNFKHSSCSDTARRTFSAAFINGKLEEEFRKVHHAGVLVHNYKSARAHHGAYRGEVVIVYRGIYKRCGNTSAGRTAGLRRLELFAVWDAAADLFDHFTKRGSHRNFYQTGIVDLAA